MFYDYKQIQTLNPDDAKIALERYLHKFINHRSEIKKLKTHEKDFLFYNMSMLRNEKNEYAVDLTLITEASEYYFNRLILTYFENLDFNKPTKNHFGQNIDSLSMEKDKNYFNAYYDQWRIQLDTRKGKYLNIVHTELNKRIKELCSEFSGKKINETQYNYQFKYTYIIAFFIYYKVKLFFDGLNDKFVCLNVAGDKIIINIYSFVHTLYRHYFPSMNSGTVNRSINDPLPFLDIKNFPYSVKDFLNMYFNCNKAKLLPSDEYLLFSFKRTKYIIWIKYGKLDDLGGNNGFEFRTLYKCSEKRDLDKFCGLTEHKKNLDISFYF